MKKKLFVHVIVEIEAEIPDEFTAVSDQYDYANETYLAEDELCKAIKQYNFTIDDYWMVNLGEQNEKNLL